MKRAIKNKKITTKKVVTKKVKSKKVTNKKITKNKKRSYGILRRPQEKETRNKKTKRPLQKGRISSGNISKKDLQESLRKDFERISGIKIPRKIKAKERIRNSLSREQLLITSRKIGDYIIKRITTKLSKRNQIKFSQNTDVEKLAEKLYNNFLKEQYSEIGKSFNDLYYLRVGYFYSLDNIRQHSYFSITIEEVSSKTGLRQYIEDTLANFADRYKKYSSQGFEKLTIDSLVFQNYTRASK
jgi:hypothetical protein